MPQKKRMRSRNCPSRSALARAPTISARVAKAATGLDIFNAERSGKVTLARAGWTLVIRPLLRRIHLNRLSQEVGPPLIYQHWTKARPLLSDGIIPDI